MTKLSQLLGAFDELPQDTEVSIQRWEGGQGWTCNLTKDKQTATGLDKKFEVAIANAIITFYGMHGKGRAFESRNVLLPRET